MLSRVIALGQLLELASIQEKVLVYDDSGKVVIDGKMEDLRWLTVHPYSGAKVVRIISGDDNTLCIRVSMPKIWYEE